MRELRFRAWVYYGEKLKKPHYSRDYDGLDRFFEDHSENDTDQCIELYTGLKDKNGKEIYYGDIIKLDGKHARKDDARIYEVIEDEYYCCPTTRSIDKKDYDIYFNAGATEMYFTVIGNIHENPELLKKEK